MDFFNIMFGFIFGSIGLIWGIVLLCLVPFDIHLFVVTQDVRKIDILLTNIKGYSSMIKYKSGMVNPYGLFIGRFYIGLIKEATVKMAQTTEIFIFCTQATLDNLLIDHSIIRTKESCDITIIDRHGAYVFIYFHTRQLTINKKFLPTGKQKNIIDQITQKLDDSLVIFISGAPASGKTSIALLLALKLNGILCKSFSPSEPNNTLTNLLKTAKPTKKKPLILLLDEIDILINAVHTNTVELNSKIPTLIYDKRTYNQFFDDLFLVNNMIVVMTSNVKKETIDNLDSSYLRQGRVNMYFEL